MSKLRFLILLTALFCISGLHAKKTLNVDTENWEATPSNSSVTRTLYHSKPTPIEAEVWICNDKLYVSIEEEADATVTIYKKATGELINQKGSISGASLPQDYFNVMVCVHKPGYLPFISNLVNAPKKSPRRTENKIVREDRIWTYHQDYCRTMEQTHDIYINIRFSGTTEINGKTYHNCYAYKADNEFSENDSPVLAYMREEDNRIYAYYHFLDSPNFADYFINKYGIDVMPQCPATQRFNNESCERMILDFNLKKGETLWFNHDEIDSDSAWLSVGDVFDTEYKGNHFLTQDYVNPFWNYDTSHFYAYDGIGPVSGLLPFPGSFSIDYSHTGYFLIKMTDLDGTVLFEDPIYGSAVGNPEICTEEYLSPVMESRYYDMQGRRLQSEPTDGIYIKIDILEDGTTKVTRNFGK